MQVLFYKLFFKKFMGQNTFEQVRGGADLRLSPSAAAAAPSQRRRGRGLSPRPAASAGVSPPRNGGAARAAEVRQRRRRRRRQGVPPAEVVRLAVRGTGRRRRKTILQGEKNTFFAFFFAGLRVLALVPQEPAGPQALPGHRLQRIGKENTTETISQHIANPSIFSLLPAGVHDVRSHLHRA